MKKGSCNLEFVFFLGHPSLKWSVQQAIDWMKELAEFDIYWIEEPTCADDVLGHKAIADALKPYGN